MRSVVENDGMYAKKFSFYLAYNPKNWEAVLLDYDNPSWTSDIRDASVLEHKCDIRLDQSILENFPNIRIMRVE